MYKGFNLKLDNEKYFKDFHGQGMEIHSKNNSIAQKRLSDFFDSDGKLAASKIMENWFPAIKANVFISHAHKDAELAIGLAGWLYSELGISSFIDSCVWGYSDELLKEIDEKYSLKNDGYYSYQKRNRTTGHVNMMLSTSLAKMIDQCECVIFINTPQSISCKGHVESDGTESPWIYAEIETTRIIEKKLPRKLMKKSLEEFPILESASADIKYDLTLNHLHILKETNIRNWGSCGKRGTDALDYLYNQC